jgi:putative transposase
VVVESRGEDEDFEQRVPSSYHAPEAIIRLPAYDYASGGAYFVTLCTQQRHPFFVDEALQRVLEEAWCALPHRFVGVSLDEFVIMPNHVHFIIWLHAEREGTPALGTLIAAYKSITTVTWLRLLKSENRRAPGKFWQRNYYEHVLRDEADLAQKRAYIRNNPAKRDERFL